MTLPLNPYDMSPEELALERELEKMRADLNRRDNGIFAIKDDVFVRLSRRATRQIGDNKRPLGAQQ